MQRRFINLLFTILLPALTFAESPSECLERSSIFGDFPSFTATCEMTISGNGAARVRGLKISTLRAKEKDYSLVRVMSPANLSGLAFLRKAEGKNESVWLKTSTGTKRLSAGGSNERVFGSDFTAADFSVPANDSESRSWGPASGTADLLTVISSSASGSKTFSIKRDSGLVVGVEFKDAAGNAYKRYELLKTGTENGREYPAECVMKDLKRGGETKLVVTKLDAASAVKESTFNPGAL